MNQIYEFEPNPNSHVKVIKEISSHASASTELEDQPLPIPGELDDSGSQASKPIEPAHYQQLSKKAETELRQTLWPHSVRQSLCSLSTKPIRDSSSKSGRKRSASTRSQIVVSSS